MLVNDCTKMPSYKTIPFYMVTKGEVFEKIDTGEICMKIERISKEVPSSGNPSYEFGNAVCIRTGFTTLIGDTEEVYELKASMDYSRIYLEQGRHHTCATSTIIPTTKEGE